MDRSQTAQIWVIPLLLGGAQMAYKDKVYVCFDGENDVRHFQLMKNWEQNDKTPFSFLNAQEFKRSYETIVAATTKRKLREKLITSDVFVVLIGQQTKYLYRVERWEMELALELGRPIIGINLNGLRNLDNELCPPILRDKLVLYISFNAEILQYALENWPESFEKNKSAGSVGPFYYKDPVYGSLGL
jgi:hypothetical protein